MQMSQVKPSYESWKKATEWSIQKWELPMAVSLNRTKNFHSRLQKTI